MPGNILFVSKNKRLLGRGGGNGRRSSRQECNSPFSPLGVSLYEPAWAVISCRAAAAPVFSLSFVTWPQCYGFKQKCATAQCTRRRHPPPLPPTSPRSPHAALPSPLAHFHYPGGIQGVMASRAAVPASWAQTFPR